MAYTGMSYIQLYKNKALTTMIPKNTDGNYVLDLGVISNNAHNPFIFNIFAKNIGDHKAYDFTVTSLSNGTTVNFAKQDVMVGGIVKIPISININKSATTQTVVTLKVDFDSV